MLTNVAIAAASVATSIDCGPIARLSDGARAPPKLKSAASGS